MVPIQNNDCLFTSADAFSHDDNNRKLLRISKITQHNHFTY